MRNALFGLADARGNIPHLTREQPEAEGRRLNAQRYETVGQMDAALDHRARPRMPQIGDVTVQEQAANTSGSLLGAFLLLAIGAGITYLLTHKEDVDDEPGELRTNPELTGAPALALPPHTPTQVTVVMPTSTPAAKPKKKRRRRASVKAVPVVVIPPEEKPTRRRRSRKAAVVAPVVVAAPVVNPVVVTVPPPET